MKKKPFKILIFLIVFLFLLLVLGYSNTRFHKKNKWYEYPNQPLPISYREKKFPESNLRGYLSIIPNTTYNGPIPFERQNDKEIGKYFINNQGFFSFKQFPSIYEEVKFKKNRILWFGGSGAQGHGASCPEKIACNLLEKNLKLNYKDDVEIYNYASAGHTSDDNSFVFYKMAFLLKPKLIIFYSGPNDLAHLVFINFPIGLEEQADSILENEFNFKELSIVPFYVRILTNLFPELGKKHKIFLKFDKILFPKKYEKIKNNIKSQLLVDSGLVKTKKEALEILEMIAKKRIENIQSDSRKPSKYCLPGRILLEKIAVLNFCNNIKNIQKISGAKILIAKQAINKDNKVLYDNWFDQDQVYDKFFDQILETLRADLYNKKIFFLDADKFLEAKSGNDYWARHIHLNDQGQENLANFLTDRIILMKLLSD